MEEQLSDLLWNQLDRISIQARDQIGDRIWSELSFQLRNRLDSQLWSQPWRHLKDQLKDESYGRTESGFEPA